MRQQHSSPTRGWNLGEKKTTLTWRLFFWLCLQNWVKISLFFFWLVIAQDPTEEKVRQTDDIPSFVDIFFVYLPSIWRCDRVVDPVWTTLLRESFCGTFYGGKTLLRRTNIVITSTHMKKAFYQLDIITSRLIYSLVFQQ